MSTNISGLRTPGPVTEGTSASGLRGDETIFAGSGENTEFNDNHPTCEARDEPASGISGLRTVVRRESGQTPGVSTHVCIAGYRRTFVLCRAHDSGDRGALPLVSYMSVRTERCSSFPVTFCLILFPSSLSILSCEYVCWVLRLRLVIPTCQGFPGNGNV